MNTTQIKGLLISAKNELNNMLSLKRTKKIKYEDQQYFDLITQCSLWNVAGEETSNIMNEIDDVPSGDSLMQQLQKFKLAEVEDQFNLIYEKQFDKQIKKRNRKAIVIIDLHEQETHSKDRRISDDIRGGKHKNGTNFFFKFATVQVIVKNKIITLGVRLYRRQDTIEKIVHKLIRRVKMFVKIKVLLLDRGFRNVKIFNNLEYLGVPVLMPCIKDEKTRKQLEKAASKMQVVKAYWRNGEGEYADFKLLIIRLGTDKEIAFCTTIKFPRFHRAKYFLNLYAKRWNIETGYRLQNLFLPKTTCVKGVVRYFYFCYAVAMHNLWLILRSTIGKRMFTVTKMKFILVYFWITTHLSLDL